MFPPVTSEIVQSKINKYREARLWAWTEYEVNPTDGLIVFSVNKLNKYNKRRVCCLHCATWDTKESPSWVEVKRHHRSAAGPVV
jgi:hypothetical protein